MTPSLPGEEDFTKFRTDLSVVLGFLRYRKDKEKLTAFMARHESGFKHLAISAGRVLKACAKVDVPLDETKEEFDMCEAIQAMIDEKIAEVRIEIAQIEQEKAQIEQEKVKIEQKYVAEKARMAREYAAEKAASIRKLKKLHTFSDEAIAEILNVPVATVKSTDV